MEKKIGTNQSSGAEKVETVEKKIEATEADPAPAKKSAKKSTKKSATPREKAVKREKAAAEKRLETAKEEAKKKDQKREKKLSLKEQKVEKRAAAKQKKLERRAMIAQKKAELRQKKLEKQAAYKEKKAERRAEKIARREILKNETKAEKSRRIGREKKERIAAKRQKRESRDRAREQRARAREAARTRKAENRKHRREQHTARKQNRRGFGGWLAAVISLGVACLALGTVVTAGALRMNGMQLESESGYRATLFEMVSVSDEMENDLNKLRISSGVEEQRKLLTDLLVESALMESALERVPVDAVTGTDISSFVNRTNTFARDMLTRLAAGKMLTPGQKETLSQLYTVNAALAGELNSLATSMTERDLRDFLAGKEGSISEGFRSVGEQTHELADAPFSDEGNVGENSLSGLDEVSSAEAEERAKEYFADYRIAGVRYTGETTAPDMACYNFVLTDEEGAEYFVEITKRGGMLAFFGTYEPCDRHNFDLEACDMLAREYLAKLGVENAEAVWLSEGNSVANLAYVSVQDGVRVYPELIRVRVCEEKGRVIGLDARGYLVNRTERDLHASLSEKEARAMLSDGLEVEAEHLALIPLNEEERLCYEYLCSYGEEQYLIYVDATTGAEAEILRIRPSAQGNYLD